MTLRGWRSPNFDQRKMSPDMVVLHYTDMADVNAAIRWLCAPESKVSAHYVITADGAVVPLVDEADRAWHAGVSSWEGVRDINGRAIGIELDSPGHRPDAPSFPAEQIAALLSLLDAIRDRWSIRRRAVVAHSDVAPMRKIDPGERFPWKQLADAGHAIFVPLPEKGIDVTPEELWQDLERAGYAPPSSADEATALLRAFHRRHRPNAVELGADPITAALAKAVADETAKDGEPSPA
ncbi:MAG: N-acetylmuramoyl-L-alanine amidase [Pseudomonadota bacterium]